MPHRILQQQCLLLLLLYTKKPDKNSWLSSKIKTKNNRIRQGNVEGKQI